MVRLDRPAIRPAVARPVPMPAATAGARQVAEPGNLTAEESAFLKQGLLPASYPQLKAVLQEKGLDAAKAAFRRGKQGPFSQRYGDPNRMLEWARQLQREPEFAKLYKEVRKGDILAVVFTGNSADDPVTKFSKGPYGHTLICVSDSTDGAPPEFIEAIGLTGDPTDPSNNRVRRCPASDYTWDQFSVRLLRPTVGMAEPARGAAVRRAIAFSEAQLGKPYDYTFLGAEAGKSYYCSSLSYMAYAKGAGVPVPLGKSADRDVAAAALKGMIETLKPRDAATLMDRAARFMGQGEAGDQGRLIGFIVNEIMPNCETTAALAATPDQRKRLEGVIAKALGGEAFPRFDAACRDYDTAERQGAFNTFGLGWAEKQLRRGAIAAALVNDALHLCDDAGMKRGEALKAAWTIVMGVMPYADTLATFGFGAKDPRTATVRDLMDRLDWLRRTADGLPVIGGLYPLPGRAKPAPVTELISPSDLAWSPLWHLDYNVKPGHPLDAPARTGG